MSDFVRKSDVLHLLYGIFNKYRMSTDKNTSIGKSFGTDTYIKGMSRAEKIRKCLVLGLEKNEEIRNMPTAYSVDKVVEELEKESYTIMLDGTLVASKEVVIDAKRATEIVKQGGKEILQ